MEKQNKIIFLLFVLALLIRIIFVFSTPLRIWDETVYANLGYDLSKNPLDYSFAHNGWSDYIPSGGDTLYAWPKAGFRAPLLPYTLSLFYLFGAGSLVFLLLPVIGALSTILVYIFSRRLFNERVALPSAIFFMLIPLHVVYSSKILTDAFSTFFIILTFICFWEGYEENNSKFKVLFGLLLALSLLARYTVLWIAPVFLIYFLIRDKSLKFLKDKYLWYSVILFFLILAPWFIYSYFSYGNPLVAFIHGFKASAYWGGIQSWNFFFYYWKDIVSVIGLVFLGSLIYIFYKKQYMKKQIYLLLIWLFFFLAMAMLMPHKEDRFILPIIPSICILSGFLVGNLNKKLFRVLLILIIAALLSFSLYTKYNRTQAESYTDTNLCFLEGNLFLSNLSSNSVVITDESPVIYYYSKKETHFYPNPWSIQALKNLIDKNYVNKKGYILFSDSDMPLSDSKNMQIKKDLDENFHKAFECKKKEGLTVVYEYSP